MTGEQHRFIEEQRQKAASLRHRGMPETAAVVERLANQFEAYLRGLK